MLNFPDGLRQSPTLYPTCGAANPQRLRPLIASKPGTAMPIAGFDTSQVLIDSRRRPGARGNAADIYAAVSAAQSALDGEWGRLSAAERGRILMKMSEITLERADELARLEALDVGKPLKQGRADAVALARHLEFYGGILSWSSLCRRSFVGRGCGTR